MTKAPKRPARSVDSALRKAFKAVEAEPVPPHLEDRVEQLAASKPGPDRRS